MTAINIHTLPPVSTPGTGEAMSLKDEIESGLLGTEHATVPGESDEDLKWAFKRSVPTMVLYDEQGLKLYDRITADAPEYYLFPDELNLLKTHGDAIARSMGFTGRQPPKEDGKEEEGEEGAERIPDKRWRPARWGDSEVGKWNAGVNGEEGLGGGWKTGYDVVELGAGALRKTAHLLTALSSALPARPSDAAEYPAPITYHPLDLSRPELFRVLGEMDEAFGNELKGKVDCVGLHGDYEAGLQFIRDGKLGTLRQSSRGRGLQLADFRTDSRDTSEVEPKVVEGSPPSSISDSEVITPGPEESSVPSAITDTTCGSEFDGSGTWSPVDADVVAPSLAERDEAPALKSERPLHIVFLGSSLGNFPREAAPSFLKSLPLRKGDTLLMGLDGRPALGYEGRRKVEIAYNDPAGHTRAFEEHGWDVVREQLGLENDAGVEFVGRYNETLGRHEAYFRSKERQTLHLPGNNVDVTLEKDELLNIEWSYKYSHLEALDLFHTADLRVIDKWKAPDSDYHLWLVERPHVRFDNHTNAPATMKDEQAIIALDAIQGVPKWGDWLAMWKLWDHITLDMIPRDMLHQKPIDLRHICLFYLGHIPTFLDIHLTRMTRGTHTEPECFKDIFERGIDPDVDDPTKIHDHSEVPDCEDEWPAIDEILAFRDRVRRRLHGIYQQLASGDMALSRHVGRVLFMTFEHEALHAETLLYMLIQSPSTRPPTAVAPPQWDVLAKRWAEEKAENKVLSLPGGQITLGHDDLEGDDAKFGKKDGWENHEFGWDNEHPSLNLKVKPFKVDSLPISNKDYLAYLKTTEIPFTAASLPASWVEQSGEWMIRTSYGPVSFDIAGDWPLQASKIEMEEYVKYKGGRLPTEPELRLLWESEQGPRVVGENANVGVKNWHPVPPTNSVADPAGKVLRGQNGGVWEWTSTPFDGYEGYVPSKIYPGYSADFFDGKHFVVLGGSYATIPRIAGRKSFRNWYQANYRFSFIGARVAYDV